MRRLALVMVGLLTGLAIGRRRKATAGPRSRINGEIDRVLYVSGNGMDNEPKPKIRSPLTWEQMAAIGNFCQREPRFRRKAPENQLPHGLPIDAHAADHQGVYDDRDAA